MKKIDLIEKLIEVKNEIKKGLTFIYDENNEEFLSYSNLYKESLRVLKVFQDKQMEKGSFAIFQFKSDKYFVISFWACIMGGITAVPIPIGNTEESQRKLLNVWDMMKDAVIVGDTDGLKSLNGLACHGETVENRIDKVINIEEISKLEFGEIMQSGLDDLAIIQFSSGSTGDAKGVMITRKNVVENVQDIVKRIGASEYEKSLSWIPLTHDMGLMAFHIAHLFAGINQFIMPTSLFISNPTLWIKKASEHKVNILYTPNFGLKLFLAKYDKKVNIDWDLSSVRIIVLGAEPILVKLCNEFLMEMRQYGLKHNTIAPAYGLAEATVCVSSALPSEDMIVHFLNRTKLQPGEKIEDVNNNDINCIAFVDVGFPFEHCMVRICDDENNVLKEDVIGNIQVKGDHVTQGYYNNPQASLSIKTKDNWLITGDMGFIRNGRITITGRKKEIIIINGQNYYPNDIESTCQELEFMKNKKIVACSAKANGSENENLLIFVLHSEDINEFIPIAFEIKKIITKNIGIQVDDVIPIKYFPQTSSGKPQRYKLSEMYSNGIFDEILNELKNNKQCPKYIAPSTEIEELIVEIWNDVLGVEKVGVTNSFFEIGGHSLKAVTLLSKIHKQFHVEIPLEELFKSPTIRELALLIQSSVKSGYSGIKKLEAREYYEVSSAQKRLFVLDMLEGHENITYNIPVAVKIKGDLDIERLNRAFLQLTMRHEALRTSFDLVQGEPIQRICAEVQLPITRRSLSEKELETTGEGLIRPFDLKSAPLMHVDLIEVSDLQKTWILFFDMHHIISDGVSMGVIVKELVDLYNGETLPELTVSYKDFTAWQNELMKDERYKEQEDWWLAMFKEDVPMLNMPLDYTRPSERSFEGETLEFLLDEELSKGLKRIAQETGTTLYMVILAAYHILLSKYTGQEDIVTGSPIAGRRHSDLQGVVGMFVNTLVMRNYPEGGKSVVQFLSEVKKNTLQAFENQDVQFEELIEKLNISRDLARNPLFDVMFVMQNMGDVTMEMRGLAITPFELENRTAKFDITLYAQEAGSRISFALEYCSKLFQKSKMLRLIEHFKNVLGEVVRDLEVKISDIPMLTEKEKERILYEFNDTKAEYPRDKTIHQLFEEQAERTPDNTALVFGEQSMTYDELNKKANRLAWVLNKKGVGHDTVVGIMAERSFEMMIGIIGTLKAGGAYMPIDPNYPQNRIAYMLEDSNTEILLTQNHLMDQVLFSGVKLDLNDEGCYQRNQKNPAYVNTPNDLAYVIYTSGSTGMPKGVMVEHGALVNRIHWMQKTYPLKEEDVILQKTTYTFDVSVWELLWWSVCGASLHILDVGGEKKPAVIIEALEKSNITTIHFVPSMLNAFLQYLEDGKQNLCFPRLNRVFCSGEALHPKQVQKFMNLKSGGCHAELINLYGPTEATIDVTYYNMEENRINDNIPIGKPIDNTQAYIVDRNNNIQPIGVAGELLIGGAGVARGVYKQSRVNEGKVCGQPIFTRRQAVPDRGFSQVA